MIPADSTLDGAPVITDFHKVRLWSDLNGDGVIDAGELFTLEETCVKAIGTSYQAIHLPFGSYGDSSEEQGLFYWNDHCSDPALPASQGSSPVFDLWPVYDLTGQFTLSP
jgi:hypothetical protein